MWKRLLIMTATAAGLSAAIAVNADAQRINMGTQTSTHVNSRMATTHARVGVNARAQVRGPEFRPRGWSHGRKTGWHCRVGARGCVPPGLR